MISNAIEDRPLPIYGAACMLIGCMWATIALFVGKARRGADGEIYNVGGSRALPNWKSWNLFSIRFAPRSLMIPSLTARATTAATPSTEKLQNATGWQALVPFEDGLRATIDRYGANSEWMLVKSGEYRTYYERNYASR